jgi:hypothetical protein
MSWLLNVSCLASLSFASLFFNFRLAHPDNVSFARRGPPTLMARCLGSLPTAGRLAVPAPCSVMAAALTIIREVPGPTSGRFLNSGSSLSLTDDPTADSLIATGPLDGTPEFSAPC